MPFSPAHKIHGVIAWAPEEALLVEAKPTHERLIDLNIFLPTGQWSVVSGQRVSSEFSPEAMQSLHEA